MGAKGRTLIGAALAVGLLTGAAEGTWSLQSDANGMAGWKGMHEYRSLPPVLAIDAEYCVYAPSSDPGTVPSPFELTFGQGSDPSEGSHYVYAYQLFNNVDPHPYDQIKGSCSRFSVHLDDDEEAASIGHVAPPEGSGFLAPLISGFEAETAGWTFNPTLNYGLLSEVLIFTSPYGPEWDRGGVSGAGLGDSDDESMPSPLPEPTTVGLLGIGVAWLFARRRLGCRKTA